MFDLRDHKVNGEDASKGKQSYQNIWIFNILLPQKYRQKNFKIPLLLGQDKGGGGIYNLLGLILPPI